MTTEKLAAGVEACLQGLERGASLEQVLAHSPQDADELRPLLEAALRVRVAGNQDPTPASAARSRARLVAAARSSHRAGGAAVVLIPRIRTALASLAVAGALALGGGGSLLASVHALPGDALYPLKIFRERTRINLTSDVGKRLQLERAYDDARVSEVEALIEQARTAQVDFTGALTKRSDGEWIVAGLRVLVPPPARVADDLLVGAYVEIQGVSMADGSIMAVRIRLHDERIEGPLEYLSASRWVVGGVVLSVGPDSEIRGTPRLGDIVRADILRLANGTLRIRSAEVVRRAADTPTMPVISTLTRPAEADDATEVEESEATPEADQTPNGDELDKEGGTPGSTSTSLPEDTRRPEEPPRPTVTPDPTDND